MTEINIDDVVVDDIIYLSSGDKIPADGILIDGEVSVDESSLMVNQKRNIFMQMIQYLEVQ